MRKIFSVTSRQVRRLAMEYAESGEKKSFQQLLQQLYERGEYQPHPTSLDLDRR